MCPNILHSDLPLSKFNLNKLNASELLVGEKGEILSFGDEHIALILNDLGLFQGEVVELTALAPLGDPICLKTEETLVSIRKADAKHIIVKKCSE